MSTTTTTQAWFHPPVTPTTTSQMLNKIRARRLVPAQRPTTTTRETAQQRAAGPLSTATTRCRASRPTTWSRRPRPSSYSAKASWSANLRTNMTSIRSSAWTMQTISNIWHHTASRAAVTSAGMTSRRQSTTCNIRVKTVRFKRNLASSAVLRQLSSSYSSHFSWPPPPHPCFAPPSWPIIGRTWFGTKKRSRKLRTSQRPPTSSSFCSTERSPDCPLKRTVSRQSMPDKCSVSEARIIHSRWKKSDFFGDGFSGELKYSRGKQNNFPFREKMSIEHTRVEWESIINLNAKSWLSNKAESFSFAAPTETIQCRFCFCCQRRKKNLRSWKFH